MIAEPSAKSPVRIIPPHQGLGNLLALLRRAVRGGDFRP
jgi:hypothetical protein